MQPDQQNGGTLAFLGDAVLTLQVRRHLIEKGLTKLDELNRETARLVNATFQASFIHSVLNELDEKELEIYHRGRNFKSHSSAKNAALLDYRAATGLEALWGYWYLTGNNRRLEEMFMKMLEVQEQS